MNNAHAYLEQFAHCAVSDAGLAVGERANKFYFVAETRDYSLLGKEVAIY